MADTANPFEGWLGIIVPPDKPGFRSLGPQGFTSLDHQPGATLLLVPPDLLAALQGTKADVVA